MVDLASQLERALQAGDFEAAQPLILQYADAVRGRLSSASNPSERESILRDALQTLNAHLYLARAMRSHISVRLRATAGESQYRPSGRTTYTWQLKA